MPSDQVKVPAGELRRGERIAGRYEIVDCLGKGSMGDVYRAADSVLGRSVAIKRLHPHLLGERGLVERFEQEGRILARLSHPALITVHDRLDTSDGGKLLVLELIRGRSLAAELDANGPLPWRRCAEIGIAACGALEAAHGQSVVHRDIKPANILIGVKGDVHVADFGIARLTTAPTTLTGQFPPGTPEYWAPEQARGEEATELSDIYSLCCVLFEAACGRPPFVTTGSRAALFFLHDRAPVPDPQQFAPDLPPQARDLIIRGLQKEPLNRFSSARALALALARSASLSVPDDLIRGSAAPAPSVDARAVQRGPADVKVDGPEAQEFCPPVHPPGVGSPRDPRGAVTETSRSDLGEDTPTPIPFSDWSAEIGSEPKADAMSAEPRRWPWRRISIAAAIVGGLGAGATLALVGAPGAPSPLIVGTRTVESGHLRVTVPGDWILLPARAERYRPFNLKNALALSPADSGPGSDIIIGTSGAVGPRLLPNAVASGRRELRRMGELEGYRYPSIAVGGRRATVLVAPASDGVHTILCPVATARSELSSRRCEALVSSLKLIGATAFPLGPDPEQAKAIGRVLNGINESVDDIESITSATSQGDQVDAAASISDQLRSAASTVPGRGGVSPAAVPALARLRRAVAQHASAFDALASSADNGSVTAWTLARAEVSRSRVDLVTAVATLKQYGYSTS